MSGPLLNTYKLTHCLLVKGTFKYACDFLYTFRMLQTLPERESQDLIKCLGWNLDKAVCKYRWNDGADINTSLRALPSTFQMLLIIFVKSENIPVEGHGTREKADNSPKGYQAWQGNKKLRADSYED